MDKIVLIDFEQFQEIIAKLEQRLENFMDLLNPKLKTNDFLTRKEAASFLKVNINTLDAIV